MASSSEPSAKSMSDLATLLSEGKNVDDEVLQLYAEKGQLDVPDKDGRTPLMIACLKKLEDTVKFLLANGANPNSKCFKEGNTPMHYACTEEDPDEQDTRYEFARGDCSRSKIAGIITLLLGSGAQAFQENLNGWSPLCIAAFHMIMDIVDNFFDEDYGTVPLEVRIKANEILGVSAALDPLGFCEDTFNFFSQAIGNREVAVLPKVQSETSELAACFSNILLNECHTMKEIMSIKESEVSLKAHAFLVGDRLFPYDLKEKHLYPSLANFGCDLMWEKQMVEKGNQVMSCAIGFERRGESKLGSVLKRLAEMIHDVLWFYDDPKRPHLQYIQDTLSEYESILNHVDKNSLTDNSNSLLQSFGEILFNEAFRSSNIEIVRSTVQTIGRLVRIIRRRFCKENPDNYHKLSSVTFKIMELSDVEIVENMFDVHRYIRVLLRVKFVIQKVLFFDNAAYQDKDGDTLLHLVTYCISDFASNLEYIEDLALAFVRHGCPIDAVNENGETARDILEKGEMYDQAKRLVSRLTSVLTLEEIAIRRILQNDIDYRGKLPPCLCEMIEGGLKDSDLVRGRNDVDSDVDQN